MQNIFYNSGTKSNYQTDTDLFYAIVIKKGCIHLMTLFCATVIKNVFAFLYHGINAEVLLYFYL